MVKGIIKNGSYQYIRRIKVAVAYGEKFNKKAALLKAAYLNSR